jgi:hypothetical protein
VTLLTAPAIAVVAVMKRNPTDSTSNCRRRCDEKKKMILSEEKWEEGMLVKMGGHAR